MTPLYGIANCDTVRKARRWLLDHGHEVSFHDYRKAGLDGALLDGFIDTFGWEALVNRRGTTWRKLDAEVRENIDGDVARRLMLENPSLIKRPILIHDGQPLIGFREDEYRDTLGG
ncbi:MAG: ArsC family reductase [Gammaproteobacteria bacterium]|nr:MAG: ArsC family reductase [Gammaproteobacteria bacterium]